MGRVSDIRGDQEKPYLAIPSRALHKIRDFLLDRKTGNIKLNVKDGRVLGIHVEEIESLKS